jgi:hypothetical protein
LCTTHHAACACREATLRKALLEVAALTDDSPLGQRVRERVAEAWAVLCGHEEVLQREADAWRSNVRAGAAIDGRSAQADSAD